VNKSEMARLQKYLRDKFGTERILLGPKPARDGSVEVHLGGEYFFFTRFPFAVRAGVWRDPAHSLEFRGPLDKGDSLARATAVTEAVLFPKGQAQNHVSIGAGMAWPRFQIDAAYDRSKRYSVGSISLVTRF